jgi:hypothetical protein
MNSTSSWDHFEAVARPALAMAPSSFLQNIRASLEADDIPGAVADHDTAWVFEHLVGVVQYQGISDKNAAAFTAKSGIVGFKDIDRALEAGPTCPRLASYWSYADCGYRKASYTCSEPDHIDGCPLPGHPTRKGTLIQAAYSLYMFIEDICDGDLIGWIDRRLAQSDPGIDAPDRAVWMGIALLEPLRNIYGIGEKVWSMALADLLLAADPNRERWVTAGAAMVVVDTLLHNHFHRTGVLRRFGVEHSYGSRCYAPGGCSDLVRGLSKRIDARQFNTDFPADFPRFIQFAIWRLCSTSEMHHCNGVRIDDRDRCQNTSCPVFAACDRLALRHEEEPTEATAKTEG